MVARVRTVAFQGIDVLGVDAEVQIAQGLPAFEAAAADTARGRHSRDPTAAVSTAADSTGATPRHSTRRRAVP